MNEIILAVILIISLMSIYCLYKIFDKMGLYYSLIIFIGTAIITSFKIMKIFNFNLNINILFLICIMTIIYIILAKYNTKELNNIIKVSCITTIFSALIVLLLGYYIPSINSTIAINIKSTFIHNYKVLIALPITLLGGIIATTKLYQFISKLQDNIYINIVLTYIITGLIYTVIFQIFGYLNVIKIYNSIYIGLTSYLFGLIITIIQLFTINLILKQKKVREWTIY
mgnify:FL=1